MPDEERDTCRPVTVTGDDGEEITIPVLGGKPMNDLDREMFGRIVRAAQRKFRAEHPEETP